MQLDMGSNISMINEKTCKAIKETLFGFNNESGMECLWQ